MSQTRPIFLHGPLGQRQLREILASLFTGILLAPDNLWLVSPWLSDFTVLDNGTGQWSQLEPAWGNRSVSFKELLAKAVNDGADLSIATRDDPASNQFIETLRARIVRKEGLRTCFHDKIHTKGLLTRRFFLAGSMNFTYSGANVNDESMRLTNVLEEIREAMFQFQDQYFSGGIL